MFAVSRLNKLLCVLIVTSATALAPRVSVSLIVTSATAFVAPRVPVSPLVKHSVLADPEAAPAPDCEHELQLPPDSFDCSCTGGAGGAGGATASDPAPGATSVSPGSAAPNVGVLVLLELERGKGILWNDDDCSYPSLFLFQIFHSTLRGDIQANHLIASRIAQCEWQLALYAN